MLLVAQSTEDGEVSEAVLFAKSAAAAFRRGGGGLQGDGVSVAALGGREPAYVTRTQDPKAEADHFALAAGSVAL